jgi:hypothetical protein
MFIRWIVPIAIIGWLYLFITFRLPTIIGTGIFVPYLFERGWQGIVRRIPQRVHASRADLAADANTIQELEFTIEEENASKRNRKAG